MAIKLLSRHNHMVTLAVLYDVSALYCIVWYCNVLMHVQDSTVLYAVYVCPMVESESWMAVFLLNFRSIVLCCAVPYCILTSVSVLYYTLLIHVLDSTHPVPAKLLAGCCH